MEIVTIDGLTKRYPGFTLDAASFSLSAGRIAGFIGRNGAGKTTTIKSMLNLVHPDNGRISYFGMPLIGNEAQIKKRIGYSTGTIRDVTKRFYDSWDDATYERYLRLFALDEDKTPLELSEGMKVKCNLLFIISDIEKCADDIIYISKGRIAAACPKEEFADRYQEPGETLENAFLRLERSAQDA